MRLVSMREWQFEPKYEAVLDCIEIRSIRNQIKIENQNWVPLEECMTNTSPEKALQALIM